MDILLRGKIAVMKYNMVGNVQPGYHCFWYVPVLPKPENLPDIRNVCFTDGQRIYAEGRFLGAQINQHGKVILFSALSRVDKPLPRPPAERGWCYINKGAR